MWFEEKIYVVCEGSYDMRVYSNCNPFNRYEQEDQITIYTPTNNYYPTLCVYDMAVIKSKKMIVVLYDTYESAALKIKLPSKQLTIDYKINSIGSSRKMSITSSDQMLLFGKRGRPERFYIDIYTPAEPNFQLTKSILLSTNVSVESNVVQTSTGNFIFAYHENNAYLISELSADGKKLIRTVDPLDLSVDLWPSYLAISKHDEVFIADTKGGRILLLNPEFRSFISPISGLQRLQYLQEEHQLIVGTTDARVLIYDLKWTPTYSNLDGLSVCKVNKKIAESEWRIALLN